MIASLLSWLLLTSQLSESFAQNNCHNRQLQKTCDFEVPKNRISLATSVVHGGYSVAQCEQTMRDFKWEVMIFCPKSIFCGLGLDLDKDFYELLQGSVNSKPVDETCQIVIRKDGNTCDTVIQKLFDARILPGKKIIMIYFL